MIDPQLYAENNQLWGCIAAEHLKMYLEKFQWRSDRKDTLIDVGSRTGDMLIEIICPCLRREFERLVFSDSSPDMVEFAKYRYDYVEKSEFKVLDIGTEKELPSDLKGQFDHVISFHYLQLVEKQEQIFENIFQLIRPDDGGDCYLQLFSGGPLYDAYIRLSKSPKWSKYMTEVGRYTPYWHNVKDPELEARKMLENCGFSDITVKLHKTYQEVDDIELLIYNLLGISPYVHNMPKELHQDFMTDLIETINSIDEHFKISNESEDDIRFNFELLIIYAKRPAIKQKN